MDESDIVFTEIKRESWEVIACKSQEMWDFKNCMGAIDSKYVIIEVSINKKLCSVLMTTPEF